MKELNYILKRVLHMIPVLLCIIVLIFFMIRLIPGNPAELILGDRATPEKIAALERRMGIDKPIAAQFGIYLKQIASLDFGDSIKYQRPVWELIQPRIGVTAALACVSMFFVILFSFPLGYIAGKNAGSVQDRIIGLGALAVLSVPQFFAGTMLLFFFALKLRWFPVGNWGDTFTDHLRALVLPGISASLLTSALTVRNLRSAVIDVIGSDYVDFAKTKGLSEKVIRKRHVIRNALISTVTLLALRLVAALGSSIVVETVFSLPGLGKLLVDSIYARDYAVVQTAVLLIAVMVSVVNLITDAAYSFLDPRVKLQ